MTISENLLLFISAVGVLQSALLGGLLYFHPKSDRSVTTFLALYIACFSLPMLTPAVQHYFYWQLILLLDPFMLVSGPLLYLYVRSFKEVITWKKAAPHMSMFVIYLIADVWIYLDVVKNFPLTNDLPLERMQAPLFTIKGIIRLAQMILYFFLASRALTSYQKSIRHLFSETSQINLNWVRWLVNGNLFLVIVMVVMFALMVRIPGEFNLFVLINTAFATPYIYAATYKGITQPTIWQTQSGFDHQKVEVEMHEAEDAEENSLSVTKKKQGIDEEKVSEIATRAIRLMEVDKVYQEAELTLQQMADKLQIPSYQLSMAINEGVKKNFYDLVNGYRVEEAKRLLRDPKTQNYKILSVGFEAGFKSKTTFNTVFKKFTGVTPTEFRDHQKTETMNAVPS